MKVGMSEITSSSLGPLSMLNELRIFDDAMNEVKERWTQVSPLPSRPLDEWTVATVSSLGSQVYARKIPVSTWESLSGLSSKPPSVDRHRNARNPPRFLSTSQEYCCLSHVAKIIFLLQVC